MAVGDEIPAGYMLFLLSNAGIRAPSLIQRTYIGKQRAKWTIKTNSRVHHTRSRCCCSQPNAQCVFTITWVSTEAKAAASLTQ